MKKLLGFMLGIILVFTTFLLYPLSPVVNARCAVSEIQGIEIFEYTEEDLTRMINALQCVRDYFKEFEGLLSQTSAYRHILKVLSENNGLTCSTSQGTTENDVIVRLIFLYGGLVDVSYSGPNGSVLYFYSKRADIGHLSEGACNLIKMFKKSLSKQNEKDRYIVLFFAKKPNNTENVALSGARIPLKFAIDVFNRTPDIGHVG